MSIWPRKVVAQNSFPRSSDGKEPACNAGDLGSILGQEDPLEKEMATHSSILAWRILWTKEAGGLQATGLQESDTTEATEHADTNTAA